MEREVYETVIREERGKQGEKWYMGRRGRDCEHLLICNLLASHGYIGTIKTASMPVKGKKGVNIGGPTTLHPLVRRTKVRPR